MDTTVVSDGKATASNASCGEIVLEYRKYYDVRGLTKTALRRYLISRVPTGA